jgi:hypothetical protein
MAATAAGVCGEGENERERGELRLGFAWGCPRVVLIPPPPTAATAPGDGRRVSLAGSGARGVDTATEEGDNAGGPDLLGWSCTVATGQADAQWWFLPFSFLEKDIAPVVII